SSRSRCSPAGGCSASCAKPTAATPSRPTSCPPCAREGDRVKAVLFDFGGVITEPLGSVLGALAATAGADPAEFAALLFGDYGADGHPWNRLERGEIAFAELCEWARAEGVRRGWNLDLSPAIDHLAALPFRPAVL